MKRILIPGILVLTLLGAIDAALLTVNKIEDAVTGASHSGVCQAVSKKGCQIAFDSALASVGPIPLSLIAAVTYLLMLGLIVICLTGRLRQFAPPSLYLISAGAVVYSIVLAGYSWSKSSWCPYCIGLYVINLGLFVLTALLHGKGLLKGGLSACKAILRQRRLLGLTALFYLVGLGSAYGSYEGFVSYQNRGMTELAVKLVQRSVNEGRLPMPTDGAPALGPDSARYTIIKFSDFQCPHCKRLWKALEQLRERRTEDVRLVFRNFPLSSECNPFVASTLHPRACAAAIAATCAHKQGRFWQMAGLLFENQEQLSDAEIREYADDVELDLKAFDTCIAAPETQRQVRRDALVAASVGVSGTPTSLVNGFRFVGGLPFTLWQQILPKLDKALEDGKRGKPHAQVARAKIALALKQVQVAESPIKLGGKIATNKQISLVAFLDPGSGVGIGNFRTLIQLVSRFPKWLQISVYVAAKPGSVAARRLACAHLERRKDLLLAQGATNLKNNPGVTLAMKALEACVNGDPVTALITKHNEVAQSVGVKNTPAMFIDGYRLDGAVNRSDIEMLLAIIALKSD